MSASPGNKHASRSARTRRRFIEAAQRLFAERSIDSVSVNEITLAAGQKNRNALRYHFGNREGLVQAIIDQHAKRVLALRAPYLASAEVGGEPAARLAARGLVMPVVDYLEENPGAIYYVKILSQLAALNNDVLNPSTRSSLSFQNDDQLAGVMRSALDHLKPAEAQRRLFLAISFTFHGIADICRACERDDMASVLQNRKAMFAQAVLAVETLLSAPALD
jgi:AcrR family transcriptional regulator